MANDITFYAMLNHADVARLAGGGEPWPTGLQKANIGPGFYAWETRANAERYLDRLRKHGATDLQIVSYRIAHEALANLKTLNMRNMSDDAVNDGWQGTPIMVVIILSHMAISR